MTGPFENLVETMTVQESSDIPQMLQVKMFNAVTEYDKRMSKRKGYNIYALAHYAQALTNIRDAVRKGKTLRQAIVANTLDRLRDVVLRSVGEQPYVRHEEYN